MLNEQFRNSYSDVLVLTEIRYLLSDDILCLASKQRSQFLLIRLDVFIKIKQKIICNVAVLSA